MNSQRKIQALNVVFTHWIKPCQTVKQNALIKLQRFCRRGSGAHAHHAMICKKAKFGKIYGPPVLYRQVCNCLVDKCRSIPIRIYKKNKRMQYALKKIYGLCENEIDDEIKFTDTDELLDFVETNKIKIDKIYTSMEHCYCNNKPFSSYEWMVTQPRGNFTAKDGIRYIMCELSGDQLTYYTRFKLSKFLNDRLSPFHYVF